MATKKLKKAEITLIGCESASLTAQDSVTEPNGTYAIDFFKAEAQMSFKNGEDMYYVPFHAVDHIVVTETEAEVEDRPNARGC